MRLFESKEEKEDRILAYLQEHPGLNYALDICKGTGYGSGSIYPTLVRLELDGLVNREWVEQPNGAPKRVGYRYVEGGEGRRVRQPQKIRRRRFGLAWGAA